MNELSRGRERDPKQYKNEKKEKKTFSCIEIDFIFE